MEESHGAAITPRFSLLLPTGNSQRGLGFGVVGAQLNIPASLRVSDRFAAHANLGVTYLPRIPRESGSGERLQHTLVAFNAGGSIVWLAAETFNVLLEYTTNRSIERFGNGTIQNSSETIICPGFRFAVNVESLQIVPGIGVPLFLTGTTSDAGVFFYLSFEHPF
jgi:hypothetical protein